MIIFIIKSTFFEKKRQACPRCWISISPEKSNPEYEECGFQSDSNPLWFQVGRTIAP